MKILKIRVKIKVKAVVLGIFLHAERKSNLQLIFGDSKFHLWGVFCDDGCIRVSAQLFICYGLL